MHDVQFSFETRFHFTPWTFSSRSPMTDVEYADDTVLVARTQITLHRFLHSLQHEASKHGLLLNPGKCQLLRLHSNLSIHLSPHVTPTFPLLLPTLHGNRWFGCSNPTPAVSHSRCSQAIGAFRSLCPFFTIRPSPRAVNCRCTRKLCLPSSSMGVKSSYYHRVLHPSQEDGCNDTRSPSPTVMPSPDTQSAYFRPAIALPRSSSSAVWSLRA